MQQAAQAHESQIDIRPLEGAADCMAFRTLNEEWITKYFVMEKKDYETLSNPEEHILNKGGQVAMVYVDNSPVGCAALIPMGNGVYELSKMAVSPAYRGRGIGRKLLEHAIQQARTIGAKSLFLGSNTTLESAVHLYESVGFRHIPPDKVAPSPYTRANVFMEMNL